MSVYFLLPKLASPANQRLSGGMISNLRMIEQLADSMNVVCLPMLSGGVPKSFVEKKSIVLELPKTRQVGRLQYLVERYGKYRKRVKRAIQKHGRGILISTRATIPIAHQVSSSLSIPFAIVTRAFEDLEQTGLRAQSDSITIFRWIEGILNRANVKDAYRAANLLVANSEYTKQEHRRLLRTTAHWCISYPVMDLPRVKPTVSPIRTIGFVNKGIRKGKNLILRLAACMPNHQFLIYGEPLTSSSLGILNVKYAGYVSDRYSLFQSADIFLVPSEWEEPYGRVAAEAIWTGRPVIVSKRGGLPEAVPVDLFWLESDNPEDWQKKINSFSDPKNHSLIRDSIKTAQERIASQPDFLLKDLFALCST